MARMESTLPIRFILLMPWGRVGSNLLFAILQKSAPMKVNNEGLNPLRTSGEQEAWLQNYYEFDSQNASHTHIGSKQNLLAIHDLERFSRMLHDGAVRVVRLRRDNLVKAAVSQMRAKQYADQTAAETGTPRWGIRSGQPPMGPTHLDPGALLKRIGIMEEQHKRLMGAFLDEPVLDIEYEEINGSLVSVVARLRRYLDLPDKRFTVPFVKATPDDLSEAIANFGEIRTRLAGTPWLAQLLG